MPDASAPKERSPFFKIVRRGATKTFTFLGVPANSILVFFAAILLLLNVYPLFTLVVQSLTVQQANSVPLTDWDVLIWNEWDFGPREYAAAGSTTGYYWWSILFSSDLAAGYFWKPLANSLLVSVFACVFSILFGGVMAFLITRTNMPFKKFIGAIFIFRTAFR